MTVCVYWRHWSTAGETSTKKFCQHFLLNVSVSEHSAMARANLTSCNFRNSTSWSQTRLHITLHKHIAVINTKNKVFVTKTTQSRSQALCPIWPVALFILPCCWIWTNTEVVWNRYFVLYFSAAFRNYMEIDLDFIGRRTGVRNKETASGCPLIYAYICDWICDLGKGQRECQGHISIGQYKARAALQGRVLNIVIIY